MAFTSVKTCHDLTNLIPSAKTNKQMQWYKEQDKALRLLSKCKWSPKVIERTGWTKLFIREKNKCLHGDLCCTCAQLHWTLDRLWQGKQSRQNYKICPTHVTTCPKQATSRPANVYAGLWLCKLSPSVNTALINRKCQLLQVCDMLQHDLENTFPITVFCFPKRENWASFFFCLIFILVQIWRSARRRAAGLLPVPLSPSGVLN